MRRPRLVLLKWGDDVIAAHTVRGDEPPPEAFVSETDQNDVTLEVQEVDIDRRDLKLGRKVEAVAVFGLVTSLAFHVTFGGILLVAAVLTGGMSAQEDPTASRLREMTMRLEAQEGDTQQQKEEKTSDKTVEEQAKMEGFTPEEPEPTDIPLPPAASSPTDTNPSDSDRASQSAQKPEVAEKGAPTDKKGKDESPLSVEGADEGEEGSDSVEASTAICAKQTIPRSTAPRCTKTVLATTLSVRPGCYVDTIMKPNDKGTLTYPCEGDGPATLTFNGRSFTGSAIGGKLDVCADTKYEFPPYDNCTWLSAQRVTGAIESGTFRFAYGEAPKRAKGQFCASACNASGVIRIDQSITL